MNELVLAAGKQTLTGGLRYNNFILNQYKILAFDLNVPKKQMPEHEFLSHQLVAPPHFLSCSTCFKPSDKETSDMGSRNTTGDVFCHSEHTRMVISSVQVTCSPCSSVGSAWASSVVPCPQAQTPP